MLPKVELHLHLLGALNHRTAYEMAKKKNLPLPGDGSFQAFVDSVVMKEPASLSAMLRRLGMVVPCIKGDLEAIERVSYELCEYQAEEGVVYAEVRYTPHFLLPDDRSHEKPSIVTKITPKTIVETVNKGLKRGEREFGVVVRTILTCAAPKPDWSEDILELAKEFKDDGIVGIDIVPGNGCYGRPEDLNIFNDANVALFQRAAQLGIHRTVHAAEEGPANEVSKALNLLKAERIGHGYHVLQDETIYRHCLNNGVHFECCPMSSLLTGAVSLEGGKEHPVVRFARDGASFSINTDDPTITNTKMREEYELVMQWGLTVADLQKANINAMKNAFAESSVKQSILKNLYDAYGIKPDTF